MSRFDAPVKPTSVNMNEIAFAPAPAGMLPRGAQLAVLEGDPAKNQNFVLRIKVPDGYRFPVHSHRVTDRLVVISGTLMFGSGDTWQPGAMKELKPGSIVFEPAGHKHYGQAKGETVFQISGTGPFDTQWANPDEDPARSSPQATARP
ncbi:MAG: cupin domain-containing protein [Deltaproteobacteria bacterium]|nr:cupin domain-containing protein [Deltaproteobacteria bacterium]